MSASGAIGQPPSPTTLSARSAFGRVRPSIPGLRAVLRAHPDAVALTLLLVIAAAPRLVLQLHAPIFTLPDSTGYLEPGYDLATGEGVTNRLKRPIGYPLLLAAALAGSGFQLAAISAVQHLLGMLLVGLTYLLGRRCFNRWAGLGAGLLVALSAAQLVAEHAVLSEALFTPLLVGFSLALIGGARSTSPAPVLTAGVLLGAAALVRPVGQTLVPLALVVLGLAPGDGRRRLLLVSLFLGAYALVVTPWMARNALALGRFTIGGTLGESLLARTVAYGGGSFAFDAPDIPPDPDPARQTARRLIQQGVADGDRPSEVAALVRQELGLTPVEADQLIQRVTFDTIARQPLTFLRLIPESLLQLYLRPEPLTLVLWSSRLNWEDHRELGALVRGPPPADQALFSTDAVLHLYRPSRHGLILLAAAVIGLAATWRLRPLAPTLVLGAVVAYLALVHVALDGAVGRYRYPTEPLLAVLAVGGAWTAMAWLGTRLPRLDAANRSSVPYAVGALALLATAAALRLLNLARFDPSPSGNEYDEGIRLAQLSLMADGFRPFRDIYASQGPLLLDLVYPFFEAFGRQVVGARVPSVLASLLCLVVIFLVARRLGGPLCGLAALAILGLSAEFLQPSRLALAEVPSLAPAALALWLALLHRDRGRGYRYLVASALCYAMALAIKPMAFSIVAAIPPALALGRPRVWRREVMVWGLVALAGSTAVVLAIGPGLLYEYFVAYRQGAVGVGAQGRAEWSLLGNLGALRAELGADLPIVVLALAVLAPLVRVAPLYGVVVGAWLVATLLLLALYSPLSSKHVAYLLPPAALLAAGAIAALRLRAPATPFRGATALTLGAAASLYVLNLQPVLAADLRLTRPSSATLTSGGDLADALAAVGRISGPDDFLVTDHPYLAYLAGRRVPPRLADPSRTRILSGSLSDEEAIRQTEAHRPAAVIYWAGRFQGLRHYAAWLEEHYRLVRIYDQERAIYARLDALGDLGQASAGPPLARFGDLVELTALEVRPSSTGREQRLTLTWQTTRPIPPEFYLAHLELRTSAGQVALRQSDLLLPSWHLRPWPAGRPITHRRWLDLGSLERGEYTILLQVTRGMAGQPLPVTDPSGRVVTGPDATEVELGRATLKNRLEAR